MTISRLLCVVLLGSSPCYAAAKTYECPERVRLASGSGVVVAGVPAGFQGSISSSPILLSGVSVFDGPPEQGAELMPTNAGKNAARIQWKISNPSDQGIWLACNYADQLIRVAIKAEGEPSHCEASVGKRGSPSVLKAQFSCK